MSDAVGGCAHCGGSTEARGGTAAGRGTRGVGSGTRELGSGTTRRDFLTASAAAAVTAVLVSACGGASDSTVTGPVSLDVQVSNYPALANVGGMARVDNGGTPVAAVRTAASSFAAFSLICPHRGCTVNISGSAFLCPCHGARFSSTGAWIGGQQTSSLTSLTASYDATTGVLSISH